MPHIVSPDGTLINVEIAGREGAPAVLFAHSVGCDLALWDAQFVALADRYRVIRYDNRGSRNSGVPKKVSSYTMAHYADDFAAVIAAHAWEALFGDEELGLALNRTMHTDQGFTFHRPLRAGDVVHAQLGIEKVRNRGTLDMITVVVDLVVGGETVCEARSGLMHTRGDDNA